MTALPRIGERLRSIDRGEHRPQELALRRLGESYSGVILWRVEIEAPGLAATASAIAFALLEIAAHHHLRATM